MRTFPLAFCGLSTVVWLKTEKYFFTENKKRSVKRKRDKRPAQMSNSATSLPCWTFHFGFPLNFLRLSHRAPLHSIPSMAQYMHWTFMKTSHMHFPFTFKLTSLKCIIIISQWNRLFYNYVVILPLVIFHSSYSSAGWRFLDFSMLSTFHLQAVSSPFIRLDQGWQVRALGRGRVLLTGRTGFGVWSVGFVLRAAAKVVIHLQYRMSSLVRRHMHKHKVIWQRFRERHFM